MLVCFSSREEKSHIKTFLSARGDGVRRSACSVFGLKREGGCVPVTRLLMDVVEAFPRLHAGTFTLQEFFSAGDADGDQRRRLKGNY